MQKMRKVYVMGRGRLLMREGCLIFEKYEKNERKINKLPINNLDLIICIGSVGLSSNSIKHILRKNISIVFLDLNGSFKGMFLPKNKIFSSVVIHQVSTLLNRRIEIARSIILGLKISSVLIFRMIGEREFEERIEKIRIDADDITTLMSVESIIWKEIYSFLRSTDTNFESRKYNPPKGKMNCLISYGNSLLYSIILNKVVEEGLNPKIGFLHENTESRYSFILDISEIFKPFIILLLNKKLLENKILIDIHFEEKEGYTYLNFLGRAIYTKYFESLINEKIKIFPTKRKNLESFIEFEVKKIKRSILENKPYYPWCDEYVRDIGLRCE
ncbi:MAG: CRISPR-associated endonuclease Cas1 [Elusimicrobiota bacterium]|nr:CRISPR-associated endonuclease Cas1 [Endomicrobiia bacterium]MDW8166623.1 CRISPR-associated endonuclease Cas1 [Elusimicrobiota bacterium]